MNNKPTFDQLPLLVSELVEKVDSLQLTVARLLQSNNYSSTNLNKAFNHYPHTLCDIKRASELTKKAKSTLYAIARRGEIPCIKKGKCWYFYEDELQDWIEQGRHRPFQDNSSVNNKILAEIQKNIRHKPKSIIGKEDDSYNQPNLQEI